MCPVKMKRGLQILNNGTPALEGILFYYKASQKYIQQVFQIQQSKKHNGKDDGIGGTINNFAL